MDESIYVAHLSLRSDGWLVTVKDNDNVVDIMRGNHTDDLRGAASTMLERNNWIPTGFGTQYHWEGSTCQVLRAGW
jgi:hypothetical protein